MSSRPVAVWIFMRRMALLNSPWHVARSCWVPPMLSLRGSLCLTTSGSSKLSAIARGMCLIHCCTVRTTPFVASLIVVGLGYAHLSSPLICCQNFLRASLPLLRDFPSSCRSTVFVFLCKTVENSVFFSWYSSHALRISISFLRPHFNCFTMLLACRSSPVSCLSHLCPTICFSFVSVSGVHSLFP
uniref:Secreted protein n=1 Tax=Ixodes ricinus TaxID=34613 RepID=A0A6B0V226_IXORI